MKTFVLSFVLTVQMVLPSFGQGTINFGNNFTGLFRAPIYDFDPATGYGTRGQSALGIPVGTTIYPGRLLSGDIYMMALYVGTSAHPLTEVARVPFRTGSNPDALPNGLVFPTTVTVNNAAPGTTIFFQIRAWDTRTGSSYESSTTRNESAVVQSGPLGGTGLDGTRYLPPNTVGWTSFALTIPEPPVALVAAIGLGALLLRRRDHNRNRVSS